MRPDTCQTTTRKTGAVAGTFLSASLLLPLLLTVPTGALAGQLSSGPKSEAAAAIQRLKELRDRIKPTGVDWQTWRYTGGLPVDKKQVQRQPTGPWPTRTVAHG